MEKSVRSNSSPNVMMQAVKNFISKLRQNPDIYPIRYYKKTRRIRKNWQGSSLK